MPYDRKKMVRNIKGKKYVAVVDGETGGKSDFGDNRKDALRFAKEVMQYSRGNKEWELVMEKKGKKRMGVLYIREKDAPKNRFMKKGHRFVGDK